MTRTDLILFFIITLLATSCSTDNKQVDNISTVTQQVDTLAIDDYQIINSTFVHLVNPAPEGHEREFGYDNYDRTNREVPQELIREIYFTPYLLSTVDTNGFRSKLSIDQDKISKISDPDYQALADKLVSNCPQTIKIDLQKLTNRGLYDLVSVERKEKPKLEIGDKIISYSRIIYNDKRDKACFYFENYCSGLCGFGQLVLVEKDNGIWKIKEEILDWIS